MVISLQKMIQKYNLKVHGVIHIGAHYGQEYSDYKKQGIKNMLFFEPVPVIYEKLLTNLPVNDPNVKTFNMALGNKTGKTEMYIETRNQGQSSSCLPPALHLNYSPTITFDTTQFVSIDKLDNIEFDRTLYNMINIDVQGYELEVFKGAEKTLSTIDIIYSEINFEELYKGCVLAEELDGFLKKFGFIRILTCNAHKSWGDALYLKYK
jgi:FkbM family methyltransferase